MLSLILMEQILCSRQAFRMGGPRGNLSAMLVPNQPEASKTPLRPLPRSVPLSHEEAVLLEINLYLC
jgi:hypothetical protein